MIRPLHDNILIELEPAPTEYKGIIVPNEDSIPIRTGFVRALGPGKLLSTGVRKKVGLEIGERVAFFMAVTQVGTNRVLGYVLPDNHIMLKESDILCAIGVEVEIGL